MIIANGLLGLLVWGTDGALVDECASPMPTCQVPAPTTVAPRDYLKYLGISWTPVQVEPCAAPIATCIGALPQAPVLATHGLSWRHAVVPTASAEEWLKRWEYATAHRVAWTVAEKQWFARRHQPWLSAETLETIARFSSSVHAAALARDYDWTVVAQHEAGTVLKAVPKDETTRLFCPELQVTLATRGTGVEAIEVLDRSGQRREIDLPWSVPVERNEVQLVAGAIQVQFYEPAEPTPIDLPPSPTQAGTIRFAAEAIELELRPVR